MSWIKWARYYPFYKGRGWFVFQQPVRCVLESLPSPTQVSMFDGSQITIRPRDYIDAMVYCFGDHDPSISWCLKKLLRPGDTYVDIGANIGTEVMPAARLVGPHGKVHAYEPSPDCITMLEQSLALNHYEHVQLQPLAVSDKPGTLTLSAPVDNSGLAQVSEATAPTGVAVKVVTLGEEAALFDTPIRLLKIDVEGHETQVLRGAKALFEKNPPQHVLIEIWPDPDTPFSQREAVSLLTGWGYRAQQLLRRFSSQSTLRTVEGDSVSQTSADFLFSLPHRER